MMQLIFLGSGEFGLPTLQHLHREHRVLLVISQPDRPAGRNRVLTPTPIAQWAAQQNLPLLKSDDVNAPDIVAQIASLRPDAGVVIAFGQKLGEPLIAAMGRLALNLHASLLPRYRGAAPINWAILNGEGVAGVSVISLAQRMDAGLVYATASTPIDPLETAGELHDRLAALGPGVVGRVLSDLENGTLRGEPQDESLASRAPKLSKADGTVDFTADAETVRRRVHGLTPWPGVRLIWRRAADNREQPLTLLRVASQPEANHRAEPGTVLDGLRIAVGHGGAIRLIEVQAPGGKPMDAESFARGNRLQAGDQLIGSSGKGA